MNPLDYNHNIRNIRILSKPSNPPAHLHPFTMYPPEGSSLRNQCSKMGLSENSVPHCTQWFCWSLSLLNGYNWGYTLFSDKPKPFGVPGSLPFRVRCRLAALAAISLEPWPVAFDPRRCVNGVSWKLRGVGSSPVVGDFVMGKDRWMVKKRKILGMGH